MTSLHSARPDWLDVSRETYDKLQAFQALVEKWNPTINLISKSQIADLWQRHILDSAQLMEFCPITALSWCDLGSGGGFPGLVVAVIAAERMPHLKITLVESDRRKAVFLGQAARELGLTVSVETQRIEALAPQNASVVSARALAPLSDLLPHTLRHMCSAGVAIFPKGSTSEQELDTARRDWNFEVTEIQSRLATDAKILILREISHV